MKATQQIRALILLAGTALLAAPLMSALPIPASAHTEAQAGKTVAQKLVETTQASHPESDEIGISAITSRGCVGIASTDKSDIGENRVGNGSANSFEGQTLRALGIAFRARFAGGSRVDGAASPT